MFKLALHRDPCYPWLSCLAAIAKGIIKMQIIRLCAIPHFICKDVPFPRIYTLVIRLRLFSLSLYSPSLSFLVFLSPK